MHKTVTEFLSDLSYGPLGSLALGQKAIGMVNPREEARMISLINKGLTRLHSRFILHEDDTAITFQEDQYRYPLMRDRVATNDRSYEFVTPSYIIETPSDPFKDDVIRILSVWTYFPDCPDELVEVPLDDDDNPDSAFVVQARTLQLKAAWPGQVFYVIYQGGHQKVTASDLDQSIMLPPFLWEALEAFVASRIFRSMSGEAHLITAGVLEAQFETICAEAEAKDLVQSILYSTTSEFETRGWR